MVWQQPVTVVDPLRKRKETMAEAGGIEGRLMEKLHIEKEWLDRYPAELSGGELQRFCLARALRPETEILLCDEITAMLDLVTQAQIWEFLLAEARRREMGRREQDERSRLIREEAADFSFEVSSGVLAVAFIVLSVLDSVPGQIAVAVIFLCQMAAYTGRCFWLNKRM